MSGFIGFVGLVALIVGGIAAAKRGIPALNLYSRKEGGILMLLGLIFLAWSGALAEPTPQETEPQAESTPSVPLDTFSPPAVNQFTTEVQEPPPSPPPAPAPVAPRPVAPQPVAPAPRPPAPPPAPAPAPAPAPVPQPPAIRQGVHPGAFCTPGGARGVTVNGVPMICTTTDTDSRNRWRAA